MDAPFIKQEINNIQGRLEIIIDGVQHVVEIESAQVFQDKRTDLWGAQVTSNMGKTWALDEIGRAHV